MPLGSVGSFLMVQIRDSVFHENTYGLYGGSCRCMLLLYLCLALSCYYVMEQPSGSDQVLPRHRRFEYFANLVSFVAWQG